jgi:hypothetical protein
MSNCEKCGVELPTGHRKNRRFCLACQKEKEKIRQREYKKVNSKKGPPAAIDETGRIKPELTLAQVNAMARQQGLSYGRMNAILQGRRL